jgi:hypothetical protein
MKSGRAMALAKDAINEGNRLQQLPPEIAVTQLFLGVERTFSAGADV